MIESYPLHWPPNWPRSKTRERSRFKTTFEEARKELFNELRRMGVGDYNIILSTNLPLRRDGLPYATARCTDPGIAVYFKRNDKQFVFACDRWDRIEDNMRAIQHSIAAIRGIERWGASDMLERAFTGFTALPAPQAKKQWWEVLACHKDNDLKMFEDNYRMLAKKYHPDNGGSAEKMAEINWAIQEARNVKQ